MKRMTTTAALALVIAATLSGDRAADGRWWNPVNVGLATSLGGWGGYGYGYGYGGWGGGTAAGNYMQGMSQIIRAQGQYNEQTSRAYINYEEARSKYIDNKQKWTQTYFAMKEKNQAEQAERYARSRHSPESLTLAARQAAPKPLSSEALDPITGKINWPEILLADEFTPSREAIERMMQVRVSTSGGGMGSMGIFEESQKMIEVLKSQIRQYPAHEYIVARKFLESLAYSARA